MADIIVIVSEREKYAESINRWDRKGKIDWSWMRLVFAGLVDDLLRRRDRLDRQSVQGGRFLEGLEKDALTLGKVLSRLWCAIVPASSVTHMCLH